MFEFQSYTLETFKAFVESDQYVQLKHKPISPHRFASYLKNPFLKKDKLVAVLCFLGEELLAYRTLLMDEVETEFGKESIVWFSGVWVRPDYRGQGLAKQLFQMVKEVYGDALMSVDHAPASKALYLSTGDMSPISVEGRRYYRRFCTSTILGRRQGFLAYFKDFWKWFDGKANCIVDWRHNNRLETTIGNYTFSAIEVKDIKEPLFSKLQSNYLFPRTVSNLKWVFNNPWVLRGKKDERYHFSDFAYDFEQLLYRVESKGKTIGYLMFTIKDRQLRIPIFMLEKGEKEAAQFILKLADFHRLNYLSVFHPKVQSIINTRIFSRLFSKKLTRYYIGSTGLINRIKALDKYLSDGDGDAIFV